MILEGLEILSRTMQCLLPEQLPDNPCLPKEPPFKPPLKNQDFWKPLSKKRVKESRLKQKKTCPRMLPSLGWVCESRWTKGKVWNLSRRQLFNLLHLCRSMQRKIGPLSTIDLRSHRRWTKVFNLFHNQAELITKVGKAWAVELAGDARIASGKHLPKNPCTRNKAP